MPTTLHIRLIGNGDALLLMGLLEEAGIARERIRVTEATHQPEHCADAVMDETLKWAVVGALLGAVVGGLVMVWWSFPWVGALWGALIGAICVGRAKGNNAADHRLERLLPTWIAFDTEDPAEIAHVHRIRSGHREWEVTETPVTPAERLG